MKFVFENEELTTVFFKYLIHEGLIKNEVAMVNVKIKTYNDDVTVIVTITPDK